MPQPHPTATPEATLLPQAVCCGDGKMALVRIEPVDLGIDLRTFRCMVCGTSRTLTIRYTHPTRSGPEQLTP